MCALFPGNGSPDRMCMTVSVVMLAPMPIAIASTMSTVSSLLRLRLRMARSR